MPARLVFTGGAADGTHVAVSGATTFGRSEASDHVFPPDETLVSSRHVTIVEDRGRYRIVDEGSGAGTFVNDVRVREKVLADGDRIEFGLGGPAARFEVRDAPGEAEPDPDPGAPWPAWVRGGVAAALLVAAALAGWLLLGRSGASAPAMGVEDAAGPPGLPLP